MVRLSTVLDSLTRKRLPGEESPEAGAILETNHLSKEAN
jgi:hypothetical protein